MLPQIEACALPDDDIAAVKLVWESDKTYTVDCASPIGNVTCEERGDAYAGRPVKAPRR